MKVDGQGRDGGALLGRKIKTSTAQGRWWRKKTPVCVFTFLLLCHVCVIPPAVAVVIVVVVVRRSSKNSKESRKVYFVDWSPE